MYLSFNDITICLFLLICDFILELFDSVVFFHFILNTYILHLREVFPIQHYAIKFVIDLRHVGGFLWILRFPPQIKLTSTILLTMALDTIYPSPYILIDVH